MCVSGGAVMFPLPPPCVRVCTRVVPVGETWNNCLSNPSDLKELLPEFFYLPEFLRNARGLKLGARQVR